MTLHQIEAFAIILAMIAIFMSGRLRYDVVAALALLAATLLGVVEPRKAFTGCANPVIIIIASVLVVSRATYCGDGRCTDRGRGIESPGCVTTASVCLDLRD